MHKNSVVHGACYYIVWFLSILSASKGYLWVGFFASIVISMLQYIFESKNPNIKFLWIFILIVTLAGFFFDTLLLNLHLMIFNANPFNHYCSPPWMIGLWINFSIVIYFCLYKYFHHFILFSLLSFFGFPLAYLSGVKLGAATFAKPLEAVIFIAVIWAILLPCILYFFKKRIENHA